MTGKCMCDIIMLQAEQSKRGATLSVSIDDDHVIINGKKNNMRYSRSIYFTTTNDHEQDEIIKHELTDAIDFLNSNNKIVYPFDKQ